MTIPEAKNHGNQYLIDELIKLLPTFRIGDPFKLKALNKAIKSIVEYQDLIINGDYAKQNVSGIGDGIAKRIDEIIENGVLNEVKKVDKNYEKSIQDLTRITGIGNIYAKKLIDEYDIHNINDLQKAVSEEKIKLTKHRKIGLKYLYQFEQRIPRSEVAIGEKVIAKIIEEIEPDIQFMLCGSYRRGLMNCGDIDVIMTKKGIEDVEESGLLRKIVDIMTQVDFITDHLTEQGGKKFMGVCKIKSIGRRIDIRFVPYSAYYCAMIYFTGSKEFNIMIRKKALEKGYSLNEYSFNSIKDSDKHIQIHSEKELFDILGIEWIEPCDR